MLFKIYDFLSQKYVVLRAVNIVRSKVCYCQNTRVISVPVYIHTVHCTVLYIQIVAAYYIIVERYSYTAWHKTLRQQNQKNMSEGKRCLFRMIFDFIIINLTVKWQLSLEN